MKGRILYAVLIIISYVLQTSLFKSGLLLSAAPNLLLIVTVTAGFLHGRTHGAFAGFFSGLCVDLFGGSVLGVYAVFYLVIGYFCGGFNNVYFENSARIPAVMTFGADILYGLFVYISRFFLRGRINIGGFFVTVIVPEAVSTAVFAIFVYKLIRYLEEKLLRDEQEIRRTTWLKG